MCKYLWTVEEKASHMLAINIYGVASCPCARYANIRAYGVAWFASCPDHFGRVKSPLCPTNGRSSVSGISLRGTEKKNCISLTGVEQRSLGVTAYPVSRQWRNTQSVNTLHGTSDDTQLRPHTNSNACCEVDESHAATERKHLMQKTNSTWGLNFRFVWLVHWTKSVPTRVPAALLVHADRRINFA